MCTHLSGGFDDMHDGAALAEHGSAAVLVRDGAAAALLVTILVHLLHPAEEDPTQHQAVPVTQAANIHFLLIVVTYTGTCVISCKQ